MNKIEFLEKMKDLGFIPEEHNFFIQSPKIIHNNSRGIVEKDGVWYLYDIDTNGNYEEIIKGTEEEVFEEMYELILEYIRDIRQVPMNIIYTPKSVCINCIIGELGLTRPKANQFWENISKNFNVLNEFKYYINNNQFVPDSKAYKVHGYSIKDLYEKTHFGIIEAFNFLIYIQTIPVESLIVVRQIMLQK